MNRRTKGLIVGSVLVAVVCAGTGVAVAAGVDDTELPIRGDELVKASAAALIHTGGGRITETEAGDEDAYYELEVTLVDGREVDVHLDRSFNVVNSKE